MMKGSKFAFDIAGAATAFEGLTRHMVPTSGLESAALAMSRDFERKHNPFGDLGQGMREMVERVSDPYGLGKLRQSIAEHTEVMTLSNVLKGQMSAIAAARPTFAPMTAQSEMLALKRAGSLYSGLGGLDDLRTSVASLRGVSDLLSSQLLRPSQLLASVDSLARARDLVTGSWGVERAIAWDRAAASSIFPDLALYGARAGVSALLSVFSERGDEVLGAVTWHRKKGNKKKGNEGNRPLSVAALRSTGASPAGKESRRLRVADDCTVRCRFCFSPLLHANTELSITSDDAVRFTTLVPSFCLECMRRGGEDPTYIERCLESLAENPRPILYSVRRCGKSSGPRAGRGSVYLIVDNTKKSGGRDE